MKKFNLFLLFITLFFISISFVSADTIENIGYLNNTNVYLNNTTTNVSINIPKETLNTNNDLTWNKFIFGTTYTFSANKYYIIELSLPNATFSNAYNWSFKSGSTTCSFLAFDDSDIHFPKFAFTCPTTITYLTIEVTSGSNIGVFSSYSFRWNYAYLSEKKSDVDIAPIINNQTQNTQDIINNNDSNTQDIIDANNDNTDRIIDENKKNFNDCHDSYNLLNVTSTTSTINGVTFTINEDKSITINGTASANAYFRLSDNFTLSSGTYTLSNGNTSVSSNTFIFYDDNFNFDRQRTSTKTFNSSVTIKPYILVVAGKTINNQTIYPMIQKGSSATSYEEYGKEICVNKIDKQTDAINDLNDTINDDDIGGSASDGADFINDFSTDTFGLTGIITAPLNLIQSLLNSSCYTLRLPLPYLSNKYLELPCMSTIYSEYFGSFFTMYQTITYGIIAYWVIVRIFNFVKDFKNPEHDEIEVVDL